MSPTKLVRYCVLGAIVTAASAAGAGPTMHPQDDAAVRRAMEDEMARTLKDLKTGNEAPPYFLRYVVVDADRTWINARLGSVVDEEKRPSRSIHIELRVGSADDDNTNFIGSSPGGSASVTREDDYGVLRRDFWQLTDREYKDALHAIARKRASKAVQTADKDKVPDFSKAPTINVTKDLATVPSDADKAKLKEMALKLSAVFRETPKVDSGRVHASTEVIRRRLLTSEKTWTDEKRSRIRIDVSAETTADDGQHLSAWKSFTSADLASLPPLAQMETEVRALAKNLSEQRTAPQVDPGNAAVLFEGPAAGHLVRMMLANPLSGQPTPRSPGERIAHDGSMSFADKIGQKIAPAWLSVVDDPTARGPNKKLLAGGYETDDEGVAAEKVTLIDQGVVKTLLMSRAPRKELPKSNGHGRGLGAVHAQSANVFVNAANGQGRKELIAAAQRSAGPKGAVYVVQQLSDSSGLGRGQTLQALVAFRIKDGKEEPVRGLSLEGFTPKKMKKDLIAAGREPFVLEDNAHAIVTPALLFEDVDVGKPNDKTRTPPLYPSPIQSK